MTAAREETATCRGCGRKLIGKPYWAGGQAYHPETRERAKVNSYGGFVCSYRCDVKAALELEQSMPGHGITQKALLPETARETYRRWFGGQP